MGQVAFTLGPRSARVLRRLASCRRGTTAIEYAFLAMLIAVTCIGGINALAGSLHNQYNTVDSTVNKAL